MNLATFDPSFPTNFTELKTFRVAYFDLLDNITSQEHLDVKFCMISEGRSYHPIGAINQAYRKRPQALMGSIIPGDYFIISAPELEMMWRYTVVSGRPVGFTSVTAEPFEIMVDPFGEIMRSWRSEYFLNSDEFNEKPDADMTDYFTKRRELVLAGI